MKHLIKQLIPHSVFSKIERRGHMIEAMLYQFAAGFPAKDLKVIGVTGTDGKTTTSTLIAAMLRHAGYKVALLTTVSFDIGDGSGPQDNPSRMTTLGSRELTRILKKIEAAKVDWLVLEVTSHALAQHRTWGVPFSIGVMTNINHEHLDYHKTFADYRDSKKQLFTLVGTNTKGRQVGIVNSHDPSADLFASEVPHHLSYGIEQGSVAAHDVVMTTEGSTYHAVIDDGPLTITCHLPGEFNVLNSLAAACVGQAVGLTPDQISAGIASLTSVDGRMQRVDEGQDFDVIIDYAHTPDSFRKIFGEVRPVVKGQLIAVFGSPGRRDHKKRFEQGAIAGEYADIVIATEEDDRDVDGRMILDEIERGAVSKGKKPDETIFKIHHREDAVARAIALARPGDTVLLLGKGHEHSILGNKPGVINDESTNYDEASSTVSRYYNEEETVRAALKTLKK